MPDKTEPETSGLLLFARGLLKLVALIGGAIVTVLCLMALVGTQTANGWARLVTAIAVAVIVPALLADRALGKLSPDKMSGVTTDVMALVYMGFALAFVGVAHGMSGPLLARASTPRSKLTSPTSRRSPTASATRTARPRRSKPSQTTRRARPDRLDRAPTTRRQRPRDRRPATARSARPRRSSASSRPRSSRSRSRTTRSARAVAPVSSSTPKARSAPTTTSSRTHRRSRSS